MLGYELTAEELEKLYFYWEHLGRLLGVTERLTSGIKDHASAERIDELLQSVTKAPNEASLALTNATLITIVNALKEQTNLPPKITRTLLHTVARRIQGDAIADQFHIPYSGTGEIILNQIKKSTQKKRRRLRKNEQEWKSLINKNIEANKKVRGEADAPTAYERGASRAND
ncbi:oxygenase MpaB family protein [Alkalihalobacillus sp. 1P02AB]|uniref:oxygenase MpaB family protein n=1 Tax=Alkalihalobacillus sp. 1P02AB TaxID=3132260 RepID=UPI0039A6CAC4